MHDRRTKRLEPVESVRRTPGLEPGHALARGVDGGATRLDRPSTSIRPVRGGSSPASRRSSVVFPAPAGPRDAVDLAGST